MIVLKKPKKVPFFLLIIVLLGIQSILLKPLYLIMLWVEHFLRGSDDGMVGV